jgi:hypothetical protein
MKRAMKLSAGDAVSLPLPRQAGEGKASGGAIPPPKFLTNQERASCKTFVYVSVFNRQSKMGEILVGRATLPDIESTILALPPPARG